MERREGTTLRGLVVARTLSAMGTLDRVLL